MATPTIQYNSVLLLNIFDNLGNFIGWYYSKLKLRVKPGVFEKLTRHFVFTFLTPAAVSENFVQRGQAD